ncbi:MAG: hypothetical protein ABIJ47_05460 [Candidatus Bathyarchaeota archaeon]
MEIATIECLQAQSATEMSCETVSDQIAALTQAQLRGLELGERNQKDLEALQEVIALEEDEFLSTEEVLSRVLSFYNRFVPFRGAL